MAAPDVAVTLYGKRKLDPEAYAKQQARKKVSSRGATVYGRRKIDNPSAAAEPMEPDATTETDGGEGTTTEPDLPKFEALTIAQLEDVLLENASLLDKAIQAECADGKPRKGAVELFLEVEDARDGGPREEVVRLLKQFLKE